MKKDQKYLTIGIAVFIVAMIAVAILAATGVFKLSRGPKPKQPEEQAAVRTEFTQPARSAYDMGLERARTWQDDAVLARIISSEGTAEEVATGTWKAIFVSGKTKGKGYEVEVQGGNVVKEQEIDYAAPGGAELPSDIISTDQAVQIVKGMKGFEDAKVFGVEAVYGSDEKVWYWGVKTDKGTVSVEARK